MVIWMQMVIQMHNPDPDLTKSRSGLCIWITIWIQIQIFKKKKNFFNFYFSLCHYYENLTNLPLNKSEGPYTTKLVKLYITYFVIRHFTSHESIRYLDQTCTRKHCSQWEPYGIASIFLIISQNPLLNSSHHM